MTASGGRIAGARRRRPAMRDRLGGGAGIGGAAHGRIQTVGRVAGTPSARGFDELKPVATHRIGHHIAALLAAGHADPAAGLGVDAHGVAAIVELAAGCPPFARATQGQALGLEVADRVGQVIADEITHVAPPCALRRPARPPGSGASGSSASGALGLGGGTCLRCACFQRLASARVAGSLRSTRDKPRSDVPQEPPGVSRFPYNGLRRFLAAHQVVPLAQRNTASSGSRGPVDQRHVGKCQWDGWEMSFPRHL